MVANSQPEVTAANATSDASGSSSRTQKRDVYVTGFGKFGDILENPTTLIARKLVAHPNVTESHVLEVSTEGKCSRLSCTEALQEMYARVEERGRPAIFVHFGVSAISRGLKLERVGYNLADFRIPDERGRQPKNEVIHEGEPDSIETALPLEEMLNALQTVHKRVALSTDPGRYICNYVYFKSLVWVKHQVAEEHFALFVHVPEFRNVVFEDQLALATKIVDMVSDL